MKSFLFPFLASLLVFLPGCSKQNKFVPPPPPEVEVQNPDQRDVTVYRSFSGRLSASDRVDIRARVKGFLQDIHFKDGQLVKKDDLLFTIEPAEYEAAVKSAEARVAQSEADLKLAESTLKRIEQAYETKAVSELDLLGAQAGQQSAAASLMAAQAALEKAQLDLSYTEIRAPFAGRVAASEYSAGTLVGSGENTLLTVLIAEAPIFANFNIDERSLLPFISRGSRRQPTEKMPEVRLRLADNSLHEEYGVIDYIAPELDQNTGTLETRAIFENEDVHLYAGLFVKVLLPKEIEDAVLIPETAIQRDLTGSFVLVVVGDSEVAVRYIETGERVETERIIRSGLSVDDQVITRGIQRARPGIEVQVSNAAE